MNNLSHLTIFELYERAASNNPTPGGGAVTALAGALGIALVVKAARISARKADDPSILEATVQSLDTLAKQMCEDADADSEAFQSYIDAAKLPRATDEERSARKLALVGAARAASRAALCAADDALAAINFARSIEGSISQNIMADIVAGVDLLEVAVRNAGENISANLPSLPSEEAEVLKGRFDEVLAETKRHSGNAPSP